MIPIQEQVKLTLISYIPFVTRQTPIIRNALARWARKDRNTRCRISGKKYSQVKIESHHIFQYAIPFNPFRFASFNRYDMQKNYHRKFHKTYGYWNPFSFIYILTWRRNVLSGRFASVVGFTSIASNVLNSLSAVSIILLSYSILH